MSSDAHEPWNSGKFVDEPEVAVTLDLTRVMVLRRALTVFDDVSRNFELDDETELAFATVLGEFARLETKLRNSLTPLVLVVKTQDGGVLLASPTAWSSVPRVCWSLEHILHGKSVFLENRLTWDDVEDYVLEHGIRDEHDNISSAEWVSADAAAAHATVARAKME